MKTISIITNKKVDKTFESEDCLLMRTIINTNYADNKGKFIIKTERCNYYDVETPLFNEDGIPKTSEDGEQLTETTQVLKVLNKKDTESVVVYSKEQMDGIYEIIKNQLDITVLGYTNFIAKVTQIGLLIGTQQDLPYGTLAEDWEIYNAE